MTPKEKAMELYNKMYETGFKPKSVLIRTEQAKECALIAVDELINTEYNSLEYYGILSSTEYWKEVKREIEKL